jgi:hypothetical protein
MPYPFGTTMVDDMVKVNLKITECEKNPFIPTIIDTTRPSAEMTHVYAYPCD